MNLNYISKGKRGKVGYCNICKKSASLTWDHVPPKGGIDLKPVEQITLLERLTGNVQEQRPAYSQNGVKYRTICKSCNDLLGHSYDPVLNSFALGVGRILKSDVQVPSVIHYRTQPVKLIRSILGHLLAAKRISDSVTDDDLIREFLLDELALLPEQIKIFYWIYPYNEIEIVRDIMMPAKRGDLSKMGFFNGILKYFPVAYLVTNLEQYEQLNELSSYRTAKLGDFAELPIGLNSIQAQDWPLSTENGNIIIGALNLNSSVHARQRKA
jgi:hypothetical protein